MTAEGRNELARVYAERCLKNHAPDEASTGRLYEALTSLKYRLATPRSEWPAWAQYIHFRYQHLTYKTKAHNP